MASQPAILLRAFLALAALAILAVSGAGYYFHSKLVQSGAYRDALLIAASSPEVQNILGSNVHPIIPALGHASNFEGSEFAEWSLGVAGTRGRGYLYRVANQVNGVWEYSRLVLQSEDGKGRIDLAPVRQLDLPQVPAKTVYLIPLGLAQNQSLDLAPKYYKSKLGVEVTLLDPAPLNSSLIDQGRDQLNAEKCVDEHLNEKFPDLSRDPAAVVIAVTSKDMYIPTLHWRYAENYRREGRFAVVSSARLHPLALFEKMNPEWLASRLQKLLTKNIAMLYFDLPMSSDYTSLLSGGVLWGSEIDRIGGTLIGVERRWDPFVESGAPSVSVYDVRGKDPVWNRKWANDALPNTAAQVFTTSLDIGLLVQRKADFVFPDEPAMRFTRVYRNQDDRSRAFGIGGSHSFDMFLGGKMGVAVDLILADGHRIRFSYRGPQPGRQGDIYLPERSASEEHGWLDLFVPLPAPRTPAICHGSDFIS